MQTIAYNPALPKITSASYTFLWGGVEWDSDSPFWKFLHIYMRWRIAICQMANQFCQNGESQFWKWRIFFTRWRIVISQMANQFCQNGESPFLKWRIA